MYQTIGLKLITNYGEYPLNVHPTLEQMSRYYIKEFNNGRAVKDIIFRVIPYTAVNINDIVGKRN